MTKTELLELIRNGENSGVEFKRDDIDTKDFAKELVAIANLAGGRVLLGVEDDGQISGIVRPDLEEWVMNVCRDKIRPEILPYFEVVRDVEPGKHVAIVRIERGYSVHHLWHNNHRTYYIRVGTTCREASQEELERLFQQRGLVRAELRPLSGASLADLDLRRLSDYFARIRGQGAPAPENAAAWHTLLVNTEIMVEGSGGAPPVPTLAGLVLFGKTPTKFLPHARVDANAFPGTTKEYATRDRAVFQGPLVPLFSGGSPPTILENGMVEQVVEFVRRNTGVVAELQDGVRRQETRTYPDDVIREAIVNALVHRDYLLTGSDIELSIYSDRLELSSPGRLPNGITPERMRIGLRATRNQIVQDTMRDYRYLERMGLGVRYKIIQGMAEHNGTNPDLLEEGERFRLVLHAAPTAGVPAARGAS